MDYYSSSADQYSLMVNNPELAKIITVFFDDPDKLTQQELQMYHAFVMAGSLSIQSAYRLWTMGVLPDEEWDSAVRTTCPDDAGEKTRATLEMVFNTTRDRHLPSFAEALESACGFNKSN
jgi:hypothetical protein